MSFAALRSIPQVVRLSSRISSSRLGYTIHRKYLLFQPSFAVSSSSKKSATTVQPATITEKTPYDVELEKLQKSSSHESHGFYEDEPVLDKVMFHGLMFFGFSLFLVFTVAITFFTPMIRGQDRKWKYREARWLIAERRAKGVPLISKDYAPAEVVESMVPPPGDWEKEWLSNQPTTKPICTDWFGQNNLIQ